MDGFYPSEPAGYLKVTLKTSASGENARTKSPQMGMVSLERTAYLCTVKK